MFKSHIFGKRTIVSTDAEVSRAVLQSDARAFVPCYPKSLTELMGKDSILVINGSLQRRIHGLVGGFFKSPAVKAQIASDMRMNLQRAMDSWPCSSTKDVHGGDQHHSCLVFLQDEAKHVSTFSLSVSLSISKLI